MIAEFYEPNHSPGNKYIKVLEFISGINCTSLSYHSAEHEQPLCVLNIYITEHNGYFYILNIFCLHRLVGYPGNYTKIFGLRAEEVNQNKPSMLQAIFVLNLFKRSLKCTSKYQNVSGLSQNKPSMLQAIFVLNLFKRSLKCTSKYQNVSGLSHKQ